ncbi:MAG: 50S ribosomal protein L23 [Fusobacterium sp. JB021]|uniref:50S ribosomal protein L23 n=1 Tax=Fusobacterium sp. MFO224 TaxID=3378070 RepID=UPI0027512187|nr:50S ribosomal protein L23 [Fusobacterium sp. JB020]MDP0493364.1 50S ribosomal protein L23 [Fusobacterium sp. JB021]MDP0507597.1 50S ribosomal protein L23 [Fusobacterium sp. JB019]
MTAYEIIRKPLITEKTELLRREHNKYTFEVNRKANKIEIKKAVEEIFDVKVANVSTLNVKPVTKRHGMKLYKTQAKKKAIVELASGTISYFKEM